MELSVEFFKAVWLEATMCSFIASQNGSGPIFAMHAENPTHVRRLSLETAVEHWGSEYWHLATIRG
jgi:hypothetical protein